MSLSLSPASHHILYGQSKAVGGNAFNGSVVRSTSVLPGAEMFNQGLCAWETFSSPDPRYTNTTDALKRATFVGMKEQKVGSSGETGMYGYAKALRDMIAKFPGTASTNDYKIIGSCPGQGDRNISELSKGGLIYPRLEADIAYGYLRARQGVFSTDSQLRRYSVDAVIYDQGENDDGQGTDAATWKTAVETLKSDIEDTAEASIGVHRDIPLFINQIASHYTNAVGHLPNIALAQYDLGITDNNGIYLACPSYMFPYVDTVHFTADGAYQRGLYCGLVAYRVLIMGETNWKPIHPISYIVDGPFLKVVYGGCQGHLKFDGNLATGYGFRLANPNGTTNTFIKADPLGDAVEFRFTTDILDGSMLYAGFDGTGVGTSGPRTNLRDSQGDTIIISGYAMHNWCPIHKLAIAV